MRLVDIAVFLSACFLGYYIVFGFIPIRNDYQIAIILATLLHSVVFNAYSLYRAWRGVDYAQEFTAVLIAWATIFSILVFLAAITKTSADFSRSWLMIWFSVGGVTTLSMRYTLRRGLQHMRTLGYNLRHIVILGSGGVGRHVYDSIIDHPDAGFNIQAYFSDDNTEFIDNAELVTAPLANAMNYLRKTQIDQVWLAMPLSDAEKIAEIVNELSEMAVDVRLVPDIFGFRLINHSISTIAGMPVVNLSVTPMDGLNRWIKATEDKLLSGLILLLISPLLLIIAILVKLTSPGPALFPQQRLSWNGRSFTMYKFRTMPVDTERESGAVWATQGEQRATRIGGFLRKTSLDELPQFWNVLCGDMSIVGPRPERPVFVEQFKGEIPSYMRKHMVKAGITGWAQVNGWRGDTDLQKRIEHDLYYIDNWSLWLDLRIILATLFKGFVHKNAY
jgi:Undecaprenyl-phosphate glucose phosphotransferase